MYVDVSTVGDVPEVQRVVFVPGDFTDHSVNMVRKHASMAICRTQTKTEYQTKFISFGSSDLDECKTQNGGCQHNCCNTVGGYYCTCNAGYALQNDKKRCLGKKIYGF